MEPLFDRNGQVVAWLDGQNIHNLNGSHAAVLSGKGMKNVNNHQGQHLGVFKNGLFRDHQGGVVAFCRGATGGPVLPVPAAPPKPPAPRVPPVPGVPAAPPGPPVPQLGWGLDWQEFISS